MLIEANEKMPKNAEIFFCEYCDFKCFKKSNYDKHLLTRKHMKANKMLTNANEIMPENANLLMFICNNCNKNFKHSSSLSRHKNKCQTKEEIEEIDNSLNEKEIIMTLLNQNNQLQNQIIE